MSVEAFAMHLLFILWVSFINTSISTSAHVELGHSRLALLYPVMGAWGVWHSLFDHVLTRFALRRQPHSDPATDLSMYHPTGAARRSNPLGTLQTTLHPHKIFF